MNMDMNSTTTSNEKINDNHLEGKLVLLLKEPKHHPVDPYESILTDNGHRVKFFPLLSFSDCNLEKLGEIMSSKQQIYSGLVFTSQNAVKSFLSVSQSLKKEVGFVFGFKIFCVGKATSELLRESHEYKNFQIFGEDSGSSERLASVIINQRAVDEKSTEQKPLLYLCGDLHLDNLQQKLKENKIDFEELVAYKTIKLDHLEFSFLLEPAEYIVFFSPSGVETAASFFHDENVLRFFTHAKKVAIGPSTFESMKKIPNVFDNSVASKTPNPEGVLQVISQFIN